MIVRSFRGVVVRGREAEFYSLVRRRVAAFRERFAMVESHVSRRTTPEGDRFLVTTHWSDWEALRRWAPGNLEEVWGAEELLPLLASWEIEHFEEIELRSD
jgi:heme-degrading monooxygenase HmoA